MYLQLFIALKEGDLCKVVCETSPYFGRVITYKWIEYFFQRPYFVFETDINERIVLESDSHFMALPYKGSLDLLVELALQTNDEEWFHELVYRRENECQT